MRRPRSDRPRDERPKKGRSFNRDSRPERPTRDARRAPGAPERSARSRAKEQGVWAQDRPPSTRREPARAEGSTERPRTSSGRFVWGVNPVIETLRARPREVEHLYYAEGALTAKVAGEVLSRARDARVRIEQVPRERLATMSDGGVHQGVVIEVREFQFTDLKEIISTATADTRPGLVVVLDSLQDPQNVGAIIRSAHAFGAHGVVLSRDRAASITGSVVKASAGATEHCPVARVTNISRALEELKAAGFWSVAADVGGEQAPWQARLDGHIALVVGGEGPGVREGVLSHCDFKVRIPMLGQVASLNASVSAGVLLYEIARQQRLTTGAGGS